MFLSLISPASAPPNNQYCSEQPIQMFRSFGTHREIEGPVRSTPSLQAVSGIEQPHFCKATVKTTGVFGSPSSKVAVSK
ncbi:hypothetical protein CGRA01v4_12603 [Colletotrichum graminicola]|nr:hypothetical protein CGRA01v4_12603 [Colletotrichum graminicola]